MCQNYALCNHLNQELKFQYISLKICYSKLWRPPLLGKGYSGSCKRLYRNAEGWLSFPFILFLVYWLFKCYFQESSVLTWWKCWVLLNVDRKILIKVNTCSYTWAWIPGGLPKFLENENCDDSCEFLGGFSLCLLGRGGTDMGRNHLMVLVVLTD